MTDSLKTSAANSSPLLKILQKGMKAFAARPATATASSFQGSKEAAAVDVKFSPQALALLDKAKDTNNLANKLDIMNQVLKGRTSVKYALKQNDITGQTTIKK